MVFYRKRKGVRRPRRYARKSTGGTFAKRVVAVLNQNRELKVSRPFSVPVNTGVIGSINGPQLIQVMPDIGQGDGEMDRNGNQIMLKKIVVRGYYKQTFPILSNNDTRATIRHMLLKQRNSESAAEVLNVALNPNLFLAGSILENSASYLGSIEDFNTPINASAFICRKQIKKVMSAPMGIFNPAPAFDEAGGDLDSSYYMFQYTITFGKGKKLHYRNAAASAPANFPYFIAHAASPLGSNVALPLNSVVYNMTTTAYFFDS
uniref:hypothetical protein n=1 Tax=Flavobacterium sp. TaxID=239 RepID=UPI0040475EEC